MKHSHLLSTYPKGLLPAQACAKDVHLAASLFSSFSSFLSFGRRGRGNA